MAITTGMAIAGGLGLAAGAAKGGMADSKTTRRDVQFGPSAFGQYLEGTNGQDGSISQNYKSFEGMVNAGANQSDVSQGTQSQRDLAQMFSDYSKNGGSDPTAADISGSNSLADKLFGAQQTQLQQSFSDQSVEANRRAAISGRSLNDPMLAAKLAIEQTRQQNVFNQQKGGWATQYAMNQPLQRLGFAQDRTNVLSGLATQAMANRQALFSMGNQLHQKELNWRLGTAGETTSSGGGLGGMISGGFSGIGAGMQAANSFASMGSSSGGAPQSGYNLSQGSQNAYTQSQQDQWFQNRFGK